MASGQRKDSSTERTINGLWLLAAGIVTGVATARRVWVTGSPLATTVAFMSVAGSMLLVECAMVVPRFPMMYHNALFFDAMFMMLMAYNLLLTIGWEWLSQLVEFHERETAALEDPRESRRKPVP